MIMLFQYLRRQKFSAVGHLIQLAPLSTKMPLQQFIKVHLKKLSENQVAAI
jgi:hypothetical protein